MSTISYNNYGILADSLDNHTLISGRYKEQEIDERNILKDLLEKLEIKSTDKCLDIGCGVGTLLIPISFVVDSITGIDHPNCISKLSQIILNLPNNNIKLIANNFLDLNCKVNATYDKIIVYSVLHYLQDEAKVFEFINKALSLLRPGGKLLLGDIPNVSNKKRFAQSKTGKEFSRIWNKKMAKSHDRSNVDLEKCKTVIFDDQAVLKIMLHYRDIGCNTYVLPQPKNLPFGNTREDIIIEKRY